MKKYIKYWLICGVLFCIMQSVNATEFAGNEDEYTKKCQNTDTLSKSDIQVCKEYSDYLRNKNSHIEDNINETQQKLDETLASVEASKAQLEKTETQITSIQSELSVLEGNIKKLSEDIDKKKTILKNRMYILQTYMNGNELVNLLLSAGNLDEFLTRVQCIDEITNYDKDLISGLAKDKGELEDKRKDLSVRYDELFALQSQQASLLMALKDEMGGYQSTLNSQNALLSNYREDIGYIDSSLSEAERRLQAEQDREEAEEEGKKEDENKPNPPTIPDKPSNVGNAIASTARSKEGCSYVYGGTGPNSFDCSGFAQWVYRQNGIYIPRTVTSQYYACTYVNNPQPGDLLFFNTYAYLGHVGVYLGDGLFIHAGTESTGVVIANFYSDYWQSVFEAAGRFR